MEKMDCSVKEDGRKSSVTFNNQEDVQKQGANQTFHAPVSFVKNIYQNQHTVNSNDPSTTYDNEILESLTFAQILDRQCNVEQPHANTCEWILELDQYKSWRQQSRGLLWIKGKPGTGKSTLMVFLYSRLKEQHRTEQGIDLEVFFSARGTEMQRTSLGMLRSLLNQLFRQDPTIRPDIREAYKEKCTSFGRGERHWEWQQGELEPLLKYAIVTSAQQQPVIIFVDALDEARGQFASELARYFHHTNDRIASGTATARICISCRHYPVSSKIPGTEVWVERHNGNYIATFILDRLNLNHLVAAESPDQEAWHGLRADLAKRAAGVYRWAHLIVPMVETKITEAESPQEVHLWLQQVPDELEDIYQYFLQNVIRREHHSRSFLLFQWVCLAERQLSVTEMRYALAAKDVVMPPYRIRCDETSDFVKTDERMKLRAKTLSGGLAEVVHVQDHHSKKETVQVIHQSVTDFFLQRGLTLLSTLESNGKRPFAYQTSVEDSSGNEIISRCQASLYRLCLVYLTTEEVQIATDDVYVFRRAERERLLSLSPFIGYATIKPFRSCRKIRKWSVWRTARGDPVATDSY